MLDYGLWLTAFVSADPLAAIWLISKTKFANKAIEWFPTANET